MNELTIVGHALIKFAQMWWPVLAITWACAWDLRKKDVR